MADRFTSSVTSLTLARWNLDGLTTFCLLSVSRRRVCRVIAASGEGKPL
jgi:hypothetical protein